MRRPMDDLNHNLNAKLVVVATKRLCFYKCDIFDIQCVGTAAPYGNDSKIRIDDATAVGLNKRARRSSRDFKLIGSEAQGA
eukprot:scaffold679975_cov71-Prasinocladus_malaysianus.AAC.1